MEKDFHYMETGNPELDRLRAYLSDWVHWDERYTVDLGAPSAVPWARFMKPNKASGDNEATGISTINVPAMQIVDRGMAELRGKEGILHVALLWRYMNVDPKAHVFRFKRLENLSMMQMDDLADAGEKALLPMVKRMGLMFFG